MRNKNTKIKIIVAYIRLFEENHLKAAASIHPCEAAELHEISRVEPNYDGLTKSR